MPDHWLPIALIGRQQGWSRGKTAQAALKAGTGHVVSTLLIGLIVWSAGVAVATRFGNAVSLVSNLALIGFGTWIAIWSLREMYDSGNARDDIDAVAGRAQVGDNASSRTALLLILGSSPMIEGLPAFFAASKYGPGLIAVMSVAFGVSTILTYVTLCVYSTASLQRIQLGTFEKYAEVISGAFIAIVGLVFLVFPTL